MRLCAISVDLDEIPNYSAIHGASLPGLNLHAVYDVALGRLQSWAEQHALPLTLFAIARDLERVSNQVALRALSERGHEIANHSLNHPYDLTRRSQGEMRREVWQAAELIESAVGKRPVGFRAPGYVTTDALYEVLSEHPLSYSSSVFPCPWYYGAKALAIGAKGARGRPSASLVDDVRVLSAPTQPYRVGAPYWRAGAGLLELPIAVTPTTRLPFIGTSLVLAGPNRAAWLARRMVGQRFVNLELHGIDVLDAGDGLQALRSFQPDVRVPLARKLETLDRVVYSLKEAGYSFVTLAQAAEQVRDTV
jgi:peptidoglycan/xylan/chitin deacetylase (PgdA/CDA1 family)